MRALVTTLVVLVLAGPGCPAAGTPNKPDPTPQRVAVGDTQPAPKQPMGPKLIPAAKIAPDRLVWAYVDGVRRAMDVDDARSLGLTIVDLSDDWVPYIFWSQTPGQDDYSYNHHMDFYVELANDRIDVDGVALPGWDKNYLEVYGIPPSLGVLRQRFVGDEAKKCFAELDYERFRGEYHGPIRINDRGGSKRELRKFHSARGAFKKALRKARVRTLEQLEKKGGYARVAKRWRRMSWRHEAIRQMQKRLVCEQTFVGKKIPRVTPYVIDWNSARALKRFERKHNIYGWGLIFQNTADALGRTPRQNNYESLKRVLAARVVGAARILEDGTVKHYRNAKGKKVPLRNLVQEFSAAIVQQLGLTDADKAWDWIKQFKAKDFKRMWVAVKLPKLPAYYSDQMDLKMVIDRGDVWYDFPNKFDANGRLKQKPRSKYPYQTLYVTHGQDQIPLVRWRTTIGSWQPEMRHDQEYYKYKISDVGPRIWKHIIAGPVWIPPKSTPTSDMVKWRSVNGHSQRIVAHHAFGPGYASAYGLVAAYHVTKSGRDNQVRTHGSANYMSIRSSSGFSHGCHRLFNYRAVRLFSFVLGHRKFKRLGQQPLALARYFEHKGEQFLMNMRTRGYRYEMTPPVPVNVLEGNVRGEAQEPIEDYIKKPNLTYQDDLPTLKGRKPSSAPKTKTKGGGMNQPQNI